MTRIERYKSQLAELERRKAEMIRNYKIVDSLQLDDKIKRIKRMIEDAENYTQSKPLREWIDSQTLENSGLLDAIVECHLAADYIADCGFNVVDIMHSLGLEPQSLIPEIREITRLSEKLAGQLCKHSELMSSIVVNDETLIKALRKKTLSYIQSRKKNPKI